MLRGGRSFRGRLVEVDRSLASVEIETGAGRKIVKIDLGKVSEFKPIKEP